MSEGDTKVTEEAAAAIVASTPSAGEVQMAPVVTETPAVVKTEEAAAALAVVAPAAAVATEPDAAVSAPVAKEAEEKVAATPAPAPTAAPVAAAAKEETVPVPVVVATTAPTAAITKDVTVNSEEKKSGSLQKVIPVTTNKSLDKGIPVTRIKSGEKGEEKNKKHGHSNNIHHAHHAHLKIDESKTVLAGGKKVHIGDAHGHHEKTTTAGTEMSEAEQMSESEKTKKWLQEKVNGVLESGTVAAMMAVITVWALFSDDLRLATTNATADDGFTAVISVAFFMFVAEIIAASFCKDDYLVIPDPKMLPNETIFGNIYRRITGFGSFYFWLDIVATASLIFEISWMVRLIFKGLYLYTVVIIFPIKQCIEQLLHSSIIPCNIISITYNQPSY